MSSPIVTRQYSAMSLRTYARKWDRLSTIAQNGILKKLRVLDDEQQALNMQWIKLLSY